MQIRQIRGKTLRGIRSIEVRIIFRARLILPFRNILDIRKAIKVQNDFKIK